jgi:ribosome biogenesis GTPase
MSQPKKIRVDFKKNRSKPSRDNNITRYLGEAASEDTHTSERVRARGAISRKRTFHVRAGELEGRVLKVHGLMTHVEATNGTIYRCYVRGVLKNISTEERSTVTTGDVVGIVPVPGAKPSQGELPEGQIVSVAPRRGTLTRASRRREHVLVSNVDQLLIVISLRQPDLKPNLIDRYVAAAHKGELQPLICLNKADLVDPAEFQPLLGAYAQLGIPALLTSARTGYGIARLREYLAGRATVFSGQSGVGKSSLLNAIQPELGLRVRSVSEVNDKGRHTTTTAELIRLNFGGWVVDTPGVRQLQFWDTRPEEIEGFFPDFRPFVALCGFTDCTHQHETNCAVQRAVRRKLISERRYQSYLGLFNGVAEELD